LAENNIGEVKVLKWTFGEALQELQSVTSKK
jgi:hypothetical protein